MGTIELHGANLSERRMSTSGIVERLDVVEYVCTRSVSRGVGLERAPRPPGGGLTTERNLIIATATHSRPTHRVYVVSKKARAQKSRWTEIGAAWQHRDSKGFNLNSTRCRSAMPRSLSANC